MTPADRQHHLVPRANRVDGSNEIDVDCARPRLVVELIGRTTDTDACARNDHVHAPAIGGNRVERISGRGEIGDVEYEIRGAGGSEIGDHNGRTGGSQPLGGGSYTLTQFSTVQRVSFQLDGKPATALGGEGLMIDTPQTRNDWESMTPAILVESPLPGATLTSPFVLAGTANTFEATFMVSLTDAKGKKLYEHFVTATSGTGTRGTFSEKIPFSGAAAGVGTLKVYESSAKDGSAINVVELPVNL